MHDLIKGKSLEADSFKLGVSTKQANKLNDMFLNKCQKYKFWEYVRDMPEPRLNIKIEDHENVKVYLCWQLGEVKFEPEFGKSGKVDITAKRKALKELVNIMGLTDELAEKYFKLDKEGHFNDEKKQRDYKVYWYNRADIDIDSIINN